MQRDGGGYAAVQTAHPAMPGKGDLHEARQLAYALQLSQAEAAAELAHPAPPPGYVPSPEELRAFCAAERLRYHTRLTAPRSENHIFNFVSALILTAQNGFGRDVEPFLALSRETWGEEILFDAVKDLPHGALQIKDDDGEPLFEKDAHGETVFDAGGKPIPVMDPFGKQRTRLMYAAQAGDAARVTWLLARGARKSLCDWKGRTALHWAVSATEKRGGAAMEAASLCIEAGCVRRVLSLVRNTLSRKHANSHSKLDGLDSAGHTALWLACNHGLDEAAALLLENGANPSTIPAPWLLWVKQMVQHRARVVQKV